MTLPFFHRALVVAQSGGGGGGGLPEFSTIPTEVAPGRVIAFTTGGTTTSFAANITAGGIAINDGVLTYTMAYGTPANYGTSPAIAQTLTAVGGGAPTQELELLDSLVGLSNDGTSYRYHAAVHWGIAPLTGPERVLTYPTINSGISGVASYRAGSFTGPPTVMRKGVFGVTSGWGLTSGGVLSFPGLTVPAGYRALYVAFVQNDGGPAGTWAGASSIQTAASTQGADCEYWVAGAGVENEIPNNAPTLTLNATAYNEIIAAAGFAVGFIIFVPGT
jgi:hypothetical protein